MVACKITIETDDMPQIVLPSPTAPNGSDDIGTENEEKLPPSVSSSPATPPIQEQNKPNSTTNNSGNSGNTCLWYPSDAADE